MPDTPPPTEALAELVSLLERDETCELVRMYLRDFPTTMEALATGPSKDHQRLAHIMKSSSQYMGATDLAERFKALELRLANPGEKVSPADLAAINAEFAKIEGPLRAFAEN
jgi:HPt (histidine-containing phosphotransfer) domain-containing protein